MVNIDNYNLDKKGFEIIKNVKESKDQKFEKHCYIGVSEIVFFIISLNSITFIFHNLFMHSPGV